MIKNKKILILSVMMLTFAFSLTTVFAKSDNANVKNDNAKKENSSESSNSKNNSKKSVKSKELKNFEKPKDNKSNAQAYKDKTSEVANNLKNVGKDKRNQINVARGNSSETMENEEVDADENIDESVEAEAEVVAEDIEESNEQIAETIKKVESQNKFKKFLVGTDYKNLGQLRSSLAHNENQIRKLTKLSTRINDDNYMEEGMDTETQEQIQDQLVTLMQERERIKTVLQEGQEGFSILGWFGKLFGTKTQEVEVDEENEEDLEEEVVTALEGESDEMIEEDGSDDNINGIEDEEQEVMEDVVVDENAVLE